MSRSKQIRNVFKKEIVAVSQQKLPVRQNANKVDIPQKIRFWSQKRVKNDTDGPKYMKTGLSSTGSMWTFRIKRSLTSLVGKYPPEYNCIQTYLINSIPRQKNLICRLSGFLCTVLYIVIGKIICFSSYTFPYCMGSFGSKIILPKWFQQLNSRYFEVFRYLCLWYLIF